MRHRIVLNLEPMSTNRANIIITNAKTKRPMVMKSGEARLWMKSAVAQLGLWKVVHQFTCIEMPVRVTVDVYRSAHIGDVDNYAKGILDALQEAQILRNDSQVDELLLRKHKDRVRPRYEIEIEAMPGFNEPLFGL